jgi:hypothetical protein
MLKQDIAAILEDSGYKHRAPMTEYRQPARHRFHFLCGLIVTVGLLTGCSTSPHQAVTADTTITAGSTSTIDATACIGDIQPVPSGLVAIVDPELLQAALGKPMQGRLCKGRVFVAYQPVLVYRGWNHADPNSKFGSWWTFTRPASTRAQYRIDYAICPKWNPLTRISVCQVKVGSKLVVGPGQSAACPVDQLSYAASPYNQVFLPNTRPNNQPNNLQQQVLQVENCSNDTAWPEH